MICCAVKFYVHINIVKRCCNTVADVIGIVQMIDWFIEPIIICMGKIEVEDVAAQNTITVIRHILFVHAKRIWKEKRAKGGAPIAAPPLETTPVPISVQLPSAPPRVLVPVRVRRIVVHLRQ